MACQKIAAKDIYTLIAITLLWGANFSVIGVSLNTVDPYMLTALRFTCCAFPLVCFLKKPESVSYLSILLYGLLFGAGMAGFLNIAIGWGTSPGVASLVLQFSAFFTVIWGVLLFREKLNAIEVVAILIALAGLALVIHASDDDRSLIGTGFVLLAALCWSLCNIMVKSIPLQDAFAFLVWSCLFAVPPVFVATYLIQGAAPFIALTQGYSTDVYLAVFYQAYISTLLGYWVWNQQMKKHPVSQIAPYSIIVPLSGLFISWWIFNEDISTEKVVAALITIIALGLFMNSRRLAAYIDRSARFYARPSSSTPDKR